MENKKGSNKKVIEAKVLAKNLKLELKKYEGILDGLKALRAGFAEEQIRPLFGQNKRSNCEDVVNLIDTVLQHIINVEGELDDLEDFIDSYEDLED